MITIERVSHYFHAFGSGESLPSLTARLRPVCREHFRRIDRFIELALLGSGECVADAALEPDCGLYISSGIGPIGTNVVVQDAVSRDAKFPMPFSFVNTLGSSAGYYVGKNLSLSGESVFVSRRRGSFSAALACAVADLTSGVVTQALIGAIEECLLPVERFRELVGLPEQAQTAEGTHWLLLGQSGAEGVPITRDELGARAFDGYESADAATITAFAMRNPERRLGLSYTHGEGATLVAL